MRLKVSGWLFWKRITIDFEGAMVVMPDKIYRSLIEIDTKIPLTIERGNFVGYKFFKEKFEAKDERWLKSCEVFMNIPAEVLK